MIDIHLSQHCYYSIERMCSIVGRVLPGVKRLATSSALCLSLCKTLGRSLYLTGLQFPQL